MLMKAARYQCSGMVPKSSTCRKRNGAGRCHQTAITVQAANEIIVIGSSRPQYQSLCLWGRCSSGWSTLPDIAHLLCLVE
jgi:hypothetical protein